MTDATKTPTETLTPTNIIEAIAAVMGELPGIGKGERSQAGYNYRGIEAITKEIQTLLSKYKVVFVPRVVARHTKDIVVNNNPWTQEELTVIYTVYGPGGVEDRIEVGPIVALGRDNSDKGANKCMTQAFKYALLQTFCIGDAKDDGDAETHTNDKPGGNPQGETKPQGRQQRTVNRPGKQQGGVKPAAAKPQQNEERGPGVPPDPDARDENGQSQAERSAQRTKDGAEFTDDDATFMGLEPMMTLWTEYKSLTDEQLLEMSPTWVEGNIPLLKSTKSRFTRPQYEAAMKLILDTKEATEIANAPSANDQGTQA